MRKFVCGTSISRADLLKGKAKAWQKLITDFLTNRHVRFDTEYGKSKLQEIMLGYDIANNDDSVVAFAQSISDELVGILCYHVDNDDYEFVLVSGSKQELLRMMSNDSSSRNTYISIK
jgi:hypothetical protein